MDRHEKFVRLARLDSDSRIFLEECRRFDTNELFPVVGSKIAVGLAFRARIPAHQLHVAAGGYRYCAAEAGVENRKFVLLDSSFDAGL